MGKNRSRIPHEDVYQRVNYLYQAAHECLKKNPQNISLCRNYVYTLKTITRRLCLHLHPDIKRNMCKRCCVLLIPSVTSIVRTRTKRQKHSVVTCLECGTPRRYIYKTAKIPWIDREEAWDDKIVHGKTVASGNKPNQKPNNKGQGQQKANKGQGQQKAKKQESNNTKTDSPASVGLGNHQKQSDKSEKAKLDHEKPSTSQAHNDSESCSDNTNVGSVSQTEKSLSKTDPRHLVHYPNSHMSDTESNKDILQLAANVAKGKASVENSPNPNEKIEETEERPDEYLYKMTFVPSFFPYLR